MSITLPDNTRELCLDALADYLTAGMVEIYGTGRLASRDANDLNDSIEGGMTPRVFILEEERIRVPVDVVVPLAELSLTFYGLVRRIGATEKVIQTNLNALELFLDYMIARISTLGVTSSGVPISATVIQKQGQQSYGKAGQDEGWLEYHATLSYPTSVR